MENKKNPGSNLETQRPRFFLLGMVVALGLTLSAFEWTTSIDLPKDLGWIVDDGTIEIDIPITSIPEKTPPKSLRKKVSIVTDFSKVVNEIKVSSDLSPTFDPPNIDLFGLNDEIGFPEDSVPFVEPPIGPITDPGVWPKFKCTKDKQASDQQVLQYLASNTRYPRRGLDNGEQGTVWMEFVVDKKGNVTGVKVLRGIGPHCDAEAKRVVSNMPEWCPGKQYDRPVAVQYRLPIKFTKRD